MDAGGKVFAADAGSPDPDIGMVDDGVVEVVCQPGQTKSFKLVLKNVLPAVEHEDVLQDSGIVVEEVAVLKKSENLKMTDKHNLCTKEFGEGMKIRLKPGKKYKVRVTASAREEAVEEIIPVVVAFEAGGLKQFSAIEIVFKVVVNMFTVPRSFIVFSMELLEQLIILDIILFCNLNQ